MTGLFVCPDLSLEREAEGRVLRARCQKEGEMPLQRELDSLEELNEELRPLYRPREDGKFELLKAVSDEISGLTSALKKEREAASSKARQIEQLQKEASKYKDLDPEKAREALQKIQELEDQQLLTEGKVEELLTKRTERMRLDHEGQLKKLQESITERDQRLEAQQKHLEDLLIDTSIRDAAAKAKVLPSAIDDVLFRARQIFRLENGKVVPRDRDGNLVYGADGKEPETVEGWVSGVLAKQAPHLWGPSSGADASRPGPKGTKPRSKMTQDEKVQFISQHGREAYLALPD